MNPDPSTTDGRRYYGLDAVRGVMMLLGIVIHAAMFYTVMESDVLPLKDRRTSPLFDLVLLLIHSFRMPLFFLVSGFFGALLVEKYGMKGAYGNRTLRVFVPFLIALVTVLPLTGWMIISFGVSVDQGTRVLWTTNSAHLEWLLRLERKLGAAGPGHLWFLYYLMMLYLLMPLCALARRVFERRGWTETLRRFTASPWLPVALSTWTALTLWPYKGGLVQGFQFFAPHLPSLVYYGTFFVVGYLFHGFRDFLTTCERHLGAYFAASTLMFVASLAPSDLDYRQGGTTTWLHLVTISLNGVLTWLLVYAMIGLFQRFLDRDSPWVAYISQSSYWVYLVHLPIVSFAAWCLVDIDVPAVVKFGFAAAFTTVVAFVSYHYLARRTWISVLLNGRRFSVGWPWLEPEGRAYSTAMGRETDPVRSRQ
ncbi:MAG: acyltransferase family protein [Vicinamibacteria bacterium]|nr:acyltransferase family protein [Vicinamibacteria bacterium]